MDTLCCALVKSTTKIGKTIRHDLLKVSRFGYAYKFKYNFETLEKFQCMAERMRSVTPRIRKTKKGKENPKLKGSTRRVGAGPVSGFK